MRKLISFFTGVLFLIIFSVSQANAIENSQGLNGVIYAACDAINSDDPTAILSCNGRH